MNATKLLRYAKVYWSVLSVNLKTLLEYRLNFWLQMIYGPVYAITLYLILLTAYTKTDTLAGWTKSEAILLFLVFQLVYVTYYFLFMRSIRDLLWFEIRMGNLDGILTKPINTQFYVSISKPDLHQLVLWIVVSILFFMHLLNLNVTLGLAQVLLFSLMFVMGVAITYFVVSAYATAGFYVTKAAQVIEFFDKAADSAQYPMPIFPESIQLLAFSFVPIAYFSYVPTLFLLGRGNWQLVATATIVLVVSIVINQWLWKRGLQHYSSASS